MPLARPEAGCLEIAWTPACALEEAAEVALEDYARALLRAPAAEAVRSPDGPGRITGVHVCAPVLEATPALRRDLEHFARSLETGAGGGLGWS